MTPTDYELIEQGYDPAGQDAALQSRAQKAEAENARLRGMLSEVLTFSNEEGEADCVALANLRVRIVTLIDAEPRGNAEIVRRFNSWSPIRD